MRVLDTGELERRLDQASAALPAEWKPPSGLDFLPVAGCEVLSFDPSLSSTGWTWLRVVHTQILALRKGTLRTVTDKTGYLATYEKALSIRRQVNGLMHTVPLLVNGEVTKMKVAWEAPAVAGHRTESSLIAGLLIYQCLGGGGETISANHVSSVLCGNPRHDKKEVAAAVARYIPESATRDWNEHERDSAAVGLTHLFDLAAQLRHIK